MRISLRPSGLYQCATALLLMATPSVGLAQPPAAPPAAAEAKLPVRRVVLYKSGVGFFEHVGEVRGNQVVSIELTSGQLDDVLKSLTTVDLGNGRVSGITFNSTAPLAQRLRTLGLPLGAAAVAPQLRAVMAQNAEVTRLQSAVRERRSEIERIEKDQARVRENLAALKTSAEERQLVARYASQLNTQEDRLVALRSEIEELELQRGKAQEELVRLANALTVDVMLP